MSALKPGKYDSPVVVSHCARASAGGNMGINVVFLVSPGDGGAPEEISADIWLLKGGNTEVNARSLQSLACLGWDQDDIEPLNDGTLRLCGDNVTIDCQMEAGREKLDEHGKPVLDEFGRPKMYPDRLKVAWINRLGAGPVEAADPADVQVFTTAWRDQMAATRAGLGVKARVKPMTPEQIAAAAARRAAQQTSPAPTIPRPAQPAQPPSAQPAQPPPPSAASPEEWPDPF